MEQNYENIILDASSLICVIGYESGWESVKKLLPKAIMSSVNVAEVAKFLVYERQMEKEKIKTFVETLIYDSVVFDNEQAYITAEILPLTQKFGLSLGDRACLALGIKTGYPIFTADKIWNELKIPEVKIHLIR